MMVPHGLRQGHFASDFRAYYSHLFSPHDYRLVLDVLTLEEKPFGTLCFLDGQVDLVRDADIRRTASLTISDPGGALDFTGASSWSTGSVWADRMVRVRHIIYVPGVGAVTSIPFVGVPSSISRSGAEVDLELQDKTALALHGCPPMQQTKGTNAVDAIQNFLSQRTGERKFRMPRSKVRLSQDYAVGWDDSTSPWKVCQQIAKQELGMVLTYSCDGYVLLRKAPSHPSFSAPGIVTAQAVSSVDLTTLKNWVRVDGKQTSKTKNNVTTTSQPQAIAQLKAGDQLSAQSLSRNGVPIYRPVIVAADGLTTTAKVKDRAEAVLAANDRLKRDPAFSCVPFFHADVDDIVAFGVPGSDPHVRLGDCSIPLGVSGDMTVGMHATVSKPPGVKFHAWIHHTHKVHKSRKHKTTTHKKAAAHA